ncbi:uncharacterized protein LOC123501414 [Portunus trituberculatus]|uniref:uncharacterized protein LOC123501414 n=1 Tax=Portunus trituberculatus TaxID=210409 RepID=UPI001E1D0FFB|nr:uncharacterized protein LOC123501414 [Portunus trituberculatus]XP_045106170.1 uncharacterized protein LOC123501414 [Portunus trituberculatus]XP_045106171.1 uncharacterized protein LOC123501414 [Portunus trituberculatus]XP_045106172.1 uncharacterized protein LOC123501414 [Portunus trituberculatus]
MAKFLPIIGEAYTTVESGILIGCAGVFKVFGDDKAASEFVDCAGKSWREYSETSALAAPINAIIHDSKGDHKKAMKIRDSYLNAASSCADGIPVVGHAKGLVHYAMGDVQKGHKSMEASTRNVAVLGAGLATGGLGAGVAIGAVAGIGAGVAYDATATIVDDAVNGEDSTLHGSIALIRPDRMNPNELVGVLIGIVGDGLTGAGGAEWGKNIRIKRSLQNAYKNSQDLRQTGIDHKTATKLTMEAAEASKKAKGALKKQVKYATSEVVDSATGQKGVGHSGRYNKQMRMENYESFGYKSKTAAKKAKVYGEPSHLQTRYENVQQVIQNLKLHVLNTQHLIKWRTRIQITTPGTSPQLLSIRIKITLALHNAVRTVMPTVLEWETWLQIVFLTELLFPLLVMRHVVLGLPLLVLP